MKKILIRLLVAIMLLACVIAVSGCRFIETNDADATYELNTEEFDPTVVYGEAVDVSGLKVTKKIGEIITVIPITSGMITSLPDTSKAGVSEIKLSVDGHEFSVPVTVKYRVTLKADGEVFSTVYVVTRTELTNITPPEKEGYFFDGWEPEIPGTLEGNMTLEAKYTEAAPALTELQATYGDKLGSLTLPSSKVGKWVFDTPESTVGNAGKREAAVSFVLDATGEVIKTAKVNISVAKRAVSFSELKTSFVYNGKKQIPTYVADADVDIIFFEDAGSNYTDAGTYNYYFEVDDANYVGTLEGTYEIKKASVTVKISSYTVFSNEQLPKVTYEVSGFDDITSLGITVTDPEDIVNGAGVYTLTATASNPNVSLTVEPGTLTVISSVLDVGAPEVLSAATYGDTLESVKLGTHPNGKWTWQTPDAKVGDVGTRTHVAVFTPTDTRYDTLTYNVNITVDPKPLDIEIIGGTVFDYNGSERTLSYSLKDGEGNAYELAILGNTPVKDAGSYTLTLSVADTNYSASKTVTVVINKIDPATDFGKVLSATWSATLKLSDISDRLDSGYAWVRPDDKISTAGTHYFDAIFTPADTKNYNTVSGKFKVEVEKATAKLLNVNNSYNLTYNGTDLTLSGITGSHEESTPTFSYILDGSPVSAMRNAGVYTVTVTLPETTNHKAASATTTVTVSPADNTDSVKLNQSATFGDKLSSLTLPTSEVGSWRWDVADIDTATVGDAGTNKFTAIFEPSDGNYNARTVEITVTVAKKSIDAPTISEQKRQQAYTGSTLYSGLTDAEGYTVTDEGGISKGTYTVTLVLDIKNYVWSDGETGNKTLTYRIVEAANAWTAAPTIKSSWTFGDTDALDKDSAEYREYLGYASALFGTVKVTYAPVGSDIFSDELPTNAGKYIARFTATHTDAATKTEDVPFEILKKAVDIPTYTDTYVYTGAGITAGIGATELYSVIDEPHTDAGNYAAKLTLLYPNNYVWADKDTSSYKNLPYTITKATATITDFEISDVKFGEALAPTASVSLGASYKFLYSTEINGEYTATAPTAVGTYFVKVSVTGNENINASESEPVSFNISKADPILIGYQTSYEKTYDGNEFVISGVTSSGTAEVRFSVKKDGADATILNAGVYSVTIYTEENDSYNASSVTVTVTVKPADNKDTVKLSQSATFGDKLSSLTLPTSEVGSWRWNVADIDTATVGDAGTNKFTAIFEPSNGNYSARTVEITVTVAKATVSTPNPTHSVYDGELHTSGLTDTELYTVTDDGGRDKGTYTAKLTLKYPGNYKWDSSAEETIYVEYSISEAVNSWTAEPTVKTPVEYGSTEALASAEASHGGVLIEYKGEDEDDGSYTTTAPTLPGIYTVRFTTTDTNYSRLTVIKALEITKKKITAPTVTVTEFSYTGERITLGLPESDYYEISDDGSIDAKTGIVATLTLTSEYYAWSDGTEGLTKEYSYSVIPAENSVSAPVIDGWIFGQTESAPSATDSFDCEISYVYSSEENGEYTSEVPIKAGTYFVKAISAQTANVNRAESAPVSFTISKAEASIVGAEESYTAYYNKNGYTLSSISASNGVALEYAYTLDGAAVSAIKNAGTYTVTVTLPETDNYLGDEITFTVVIKKIANTDTIPAYTATYGDLLSSLAVPTSETGKWSWKDITAETTVGDAGDRTHTLVFDPDDDANYDPREITVTVTVAKAVINTPAAKNPTSVYANTAYTSGLTDTELYTVKDTGGVTVGTYYATLKLTDSANYAWDTATNTSDTTTVAYVITEGENEITGAAISGWTYGEAGNSGSATAKYGDIVITYKGADEAEDKYTSTLPTDAGNYIARFTTTDENCPIISVTRTFTIAVATVDVPSVSDVYYNGAAQTAGLASNDFYTVTDLGGVHAGDYSLTLTLTSKRNYKWSTTGNSDDVTLDYKILKAAVTLSGLSAGWTYDNPKEPTVTVSLELAKQYVTFLYSTDGGTSWSADKPTAVGDYKVKATISAANDFEFEEKVADFSIGRATPTFAAPSFAGGKHYQDLLDLSTSGFAAYNEGNTAKPVAGNFTYGDVTFAEGENASSVTLTFTPDDQTSYIPVTVTYNMTLVTVASLDKSTPYGTVKGAVEAANAAGSGTVWVLPNESGMGAVPITEGFEIYSGVTLLLPYGTRDSYSRNSSAKATLSGNSNIAASTLCTTLVKLYDGVKITNKGTIEIAGELSGGAGESQYAGHTAGSHAKLIVGNNASIVSESGSSIMCYGFLYNESTSTDGSSIIVNSGATIYQPFVLADFRGGSYMAGVKNSMDTSKASPFNRFIFMNVSVPLTVKQGGSLVGWVNLYASKTQNSTNICMIGSDSSAIIQLTGSDGYVNARYVPPTEGAADLNDAKCYLDIYGGAVTNAMKMRITFLIIPVDIDTSSCYFPIAHYYQITLNKTSSQQTATYTMNQDFKLLPGSSMTVGEDVILDANNLLVYEEFTDTFDPDATDPVAIKYILYPTGMAPARFTVNGKFICDSFGGKIYSAAPDAMVVINTSAGLIGKEVIAKDGNNNTSTVVTYKDIDLSTVTLIGSENTVAAVGVYRYLDGKWAFMQISFDTDGGDPLSPVCTEALTYPTLPTPTKTGYVFDGWYYGSTPVSSGADLLVIGAHTLTAHWIRLVEITLDTAFDDVAGSKVYAEGTYPELPTLTKEGYDFIGWFYGDEQVNTGDAIKTADDHTLTAHWSRKIFITLDSAVDDIADTVIYVSPGDGAAYPELPTLEKSGATFIGWFYGEEQVNAGDAVKTSEDHVLVAKWKTMTVITLDPSGGTLENAYVNVDLDTEAVYPTLPTPTANDGHLFAGWYYVDTKVESGSALAVIGEHTLVAKYNYQIVEDTIDGVDMTLSANGQTVNLNDYVPAGTVVTITITFNKSTNTLYVRDEGGNNLTIFNSDGSELGTSVSTGTYTFTMPESKVKIQATSSGGCVTGDTLVTLADGTQKRVDALDGTEVLLVWNFYEGKYDVSPVGAIVNHGYDIVNELTMHFSDGTSIKTLRGHGFFDMTENKFVIIDEFNINDYIGHEFAKYDDEGSCETTVLVDYGVTSTYNEIWTIVSAVHFNCVLNGLLTLSPTDFPDSPSYLMPFEIGENMKYDEAAMQADIEAYGQYTYSEFAEYCTYEQFVGMNFANWKVAVGKGYITFDAIVYLIETYLH